MLKQKDRKLQALGVQSRWNRLIRGINQKHMKAVKLKRLQILGRWGRLIHKSLEKYRKVNSLTVIGKWGYLSEMLLKRSLNQKYARAVENWKHIIKTIAIYNNYFSLKSFLSLDRKEILKVLGVKDNKLKRLQI